MTATKPKRVELEIDTPTNGNFHFRPLGMNIRGGFEFRKVKDPLAMQKANTWPAKIPGQRLGLEIDPATGTAVGYIADPLNGDEHEVLRATIKELKKAKPAPARQEFPGVHAPTWLFFMKNAVAGGYASVTAGELPNDIGGKPITDCITKRELSPVEKLTAAIDRQTEAFTSLIAALTAKLSNSK